MLKNLQARFQQYMNGELPDVEAGFRKGRGTRDQIANIFWIIKKAREFQKKISICVLLTMPKPLTQWITTNCTKFLKCWEYQTTWPASWEICMQVRKQQLKLDLEQHWFQIWKGVYQGCILSPCLLNFYSEYIIKNVGLKEAQAGIKIVGRNINNLRYEDDTTLVAESEEELKILLMKVKRESENVGLKFNIQKTKVMASGPIISWQIDGETLKTVTDFIVLGSKITADGDWSLEIKRHCYLAEKFLF